MRRLRNTRHIAPTARCPSDCHPRLKVVDQVCDQGDQDEQDQDDQEDDNVALHLGGECMCRVAWKRFEGL